MCSPSYCENCHKHDRDQASVKFFKKRDTDMMGKKILNIDIIIGRPIAYQCTAAKVAKLSSGSQLIFE